MALDFDDARLLDSWSYDLVLGDAPRGTNRALINALANGDPPYSEEEEEANKIRINVNHLSLTELVHEGLAQYTNAFTSSGEFFSMATDWPVVHKRDVYSTVVEKEINKGLKEDQGYFETTRGNFSSLILHGIAPVIWENQSNALPISIGIEDPLIPSGTYLGFRNLPFFMVRRGFTINELKTLTRKTKRDPGWNMPFVRKLIEWGEQQMTTLLGDTWPEQWAPEKWQEMSKEGGSLAWSDRAPTIDCFDVYGYVEATKNQPEGWVRRIILDSWSQPGITGGVWRLNRRSDYKVGRKDLARPGQEDFVFTSGARPVATDWQHIVGFQYANLSVVSPFRYHSVRGMGWMLYALCHLDNRLQCKFEEAVFEALMQYFKVKSLDDVNNAMKLELYNLGFIDDTIKPVPAAERFQVNAQLAELGMNSLQARIDKNSKAWTQDVGSLNNKTEKTKFEVMAKVQAANSLMAAGINQSHIYKTFEYREIVRRIMMPNSRDPFVRKVRERILSRGVPEKYINEAGAWDVQSQKTVGSGNQTMEMMVNQELLAMVPQLDPEPQRIVRRKVILGLTKDAGLAMKLVPETPAKVTASTVQAVNDYNTCVNGNTPEILGGINHLDYIKKALTVIGGKVQQAMATPQKMMKPSDLQAMPLYAQTVQTHIGIIAQDKQQAPLAKQLADALGKLMNEIKAFGQRYAAMLKKQQAAQAQPQASGDGGKAAAAIVGARTKSAIKTAEAKQKMTHKEADFRQKLQHEALKTRANIAKQDLETAANIRRGRMKSTEEEE